MRLRLSLPSVLSPSIMLTFKFMFMLFYRGDDNMWEKLSTWLPLFTISDLFGVILG